MREKADRRLVVCTAGLPHPVRGASLVLFHAYIQGLLDAGFTVLHVVILGPDDDTDPALAGYAGTYRNPSGLQWLVERVKQPYRVDRRSLSLQVGTLGSAVQQRVRDFAPQIIIGFDILPAAMAVGAGLGPVVAWLGDLQYHTAFYHRLYDARSCLRLCVSLPKTILSCLMWRNLYRRILRSCVRTIVSSGSTVAALRRLGQDSHYLPYPWPETLPASDGEPGFERPTFLMFGTLGALGSKSAIAFLTEKVHPLLVRRWGAKEFSIKIAGTSQLPDWAQDALVDRPEFEVLGFVDDLAGLAARCHAVLAPISVPVGNRSRILTALSMGALVLAHRRTALGNPDLQHGRNCLMAGDADGFARCMVFAYEHPDAGRVLAGRGMDTYRTLFLPSTACRRFTRQVDTVMHDLPPR